MVQRPGEAWRILKAWDVLLNVVLPRFPLMSSSLRSATLKGVCVCSTRHHGEKKLLINWPCCLLHTSFPLPKGGEGASDCVHDVVVEFLSIAYPYMDRVLREKRVVVCHTTTTHRLH